MTIERLRKEVVTVHSINTVTSVETPAQVSRSRDRRAYFAVATGVDHLVDEFGVARQDASVDRTGTASSNRRLMKCAAPITKRDEPTQGHLRGNSTLSGTLNAMAQ